MGAIKKQEAVLLIAVAHMSKRAGQAHGTKLNPETYTVQTQS